MIMMDTLPQERLFIHLTSYSGPDFFFIVLISFTVVLVASPRFSDMFEIH